MRKQHGALTIEFIASIWILFIFLLFPIVNLTVIGLRSYFLWFACEQGAMAGTKGSVWSTMASAAKLYPSTYYTSIHDNAINQTNKVLGMFSGITVTTGPTLTVIAQAIPNTSAATINPFNPAIGTHLDKSQYVAILQVSMTANIQPFITVPFIPGKIPGLNAPFVMNVSSQQQIENISALSY